jgi:hypothetical protein
MLKPSMLLDDFGLEQALDDEPRQVHGAIGSRIPAGLAKGVRIVEPTIGDRA